MNRRLFLLGLAALPLACAPKAPVSAPAPSPQPAPAWALTLDQPAQPEFPPLELRVDSVGRVQATYGHQATDQVSYQLSGPRLNDLKQAVEQAHAETWLTPGSPAAEQATWLAVQMGESSHRREAGPDDAALLEQLRALIPRPFAIDPDGLWAGGRLAKAQPEGHGLDLLLVDEASVPAEKRLNLNLMPDFGFAPGDLVVVTGQRDPDQAGINQNGAIYTVGGIAQFPAGAAAPAKGPAKTPAKSR